MDFLWIATVIAFGVVFWHLGNRVISLERRFIEHRELVLGEFRSLASELMTKGLIEPRGAGFWITGGEPDEEDG